MVGVHTEHLVNHVWASSWLGMNYCFNKVVHINLLLWIFFSMLSPKYIWICMHIFCIDLVFYKFWYSFLNLLGQTQQKMPFHSRRSSSNIGKVEDVGTCNLPKKCLRKNNHKYYRKVISHSVTTCNALSVERKLFSLIQIILYSELLSIQCY